MNLLHKDLTIIIKTFQRPHFLNRLLRSIGEDPTLRNLQIIIADDSRPHSVIEPDIQDMVSFTHLKLPYDVGLSEGRNLALARVKTPYFLLLDDDMVVQAETAQGVLNMLRGCKELGYDICSGRVEGYIRSHHYANFYEGTNKLGERGVFAWFGKYQHQHDESYYECDYTINFFVGRCSRIKKIGWESRIKIAHEHADFFYACRRLGVKIAHCEDAFIGHPKTRDPVRYRKKRRGRKRRFLHLFLARMEVICFAHRKGRRYSHVNIKRGHSFDWRAADIKGPMYESLRAGK